MLCGAEGGTCVASEGGKIKKNCTDYMKDCNRMVCSCIRPQISYVYETFGMIKIIKVDKRCVCVCTLCFVGCNF